MNGKITFKGSLGDELAARMDAPEDAKAYVLFAHCFTCNKDLSAINRISKALNEEGIGFFRFDFTGLGKSDGNFENTHFSSNVGDLIAAADFMRDNYKAPSVLMGHSFGGTAVLAAGSKIPEAKAVATIGSPSDTAHVQHNFKDKLNVIKEEGIAEVELVGRKFKIKKEFIDDIENQKMEHNIANLKKALLVMHSPTDDTVNIDNARQIYELAKHPKSFISLDGADHLLMKNPEDGLYVARVLSAWASRYING